ncbi:MULTISPECIES: hypothetical protein [unclassified Pseudomonas]|uniref:hypothetical protein n=1 Tax=unclassified Pseudomonas TaxID=196821 RepID=UPI0021141A93|nr:MULTISPECIES: hypothetical protein [unclassified Pseudomonas]
MYGFVGHLHMQRIGIGIAEHGNGAVAQGLGGALDAAGDFTAVGDEDFVNPGIGFSLSVCGECLGLFAGKPRSYGISLDL